MAEIGTIIQGKYEILKLIGKGGMSKVYLAMDQNLNKQWAVKEIEKRKNDKHNEIMIQSAIAEANMIKRLDHPSLPRIVDIINMSDVIYVVMDYIEGEPLSKILEEQGAQPQENVIDWALELCEVLDYLHTQNPPIIYRDMKPANVMLQPNGSVKLIDFGIAREFKEENLADTVSLGTKGYAAPEQFGGMGQTDARTDVYCLGVTLYHLVTGQNPCEPPYEIYPIRYWNTQLSGGLEHIIKKCTQMNPQDRYQSCAELLYALERYDEMDEKYRKKQKKKVMVFILTFVAAMFFLITGFVLQGVRVATDSNNYDETIRKAELASLTEEKTTYYLDAIEIKPNLIEPYFTLVELYKEDATFDLNEEAQLVKLMNEKLQQIQDNPQYGNLAFEIGKLYWYYYDYGKTENSDNQLTRMKSSIQWFDIACKIGEGREYYMMALAYRDIGRFNKDITLNVQEASDKSTYLPYWNNLIALIDDVSDENEIVCLEVYKITINAVELYAHKFKADGVEKEDMETVLERIRNDLEELETTTDKTIEMKRDIMGHFENATFSIDKAYEED